MTDLELKQKLQDTLVQGEDGRRDLLPVYADPELFSDIVAALARGYEGKVDYVVARRRWDGCWARRWPRGSAQVSPGCASWKTACT